MFRSTKQAPPARRMRLQRSSAAVRVSAPIRALTRLYYAGVLLSASAAASWVTDDTDLSAPTPQQFRLAIDQGRLKRGAPETMHTLGKMFLASFLTGIAPPEFALDV